jgi:hypothetical protein
MLFFRWAADVYFAFVCGCNASKIQFVARGYSIRNTTCRPTNRAKLLVFCERGSCNYLEENANSLPTFASKMANVIFFLPSLK